MCILMLVKTNNDSVLYTMKKLHITHKHELLSLFFLIPLSIIHHHDTNFNVFTIDPFEPTDPILYFLIGSPYWYGISPIRKRHGNSPHGNSSTSRYKKHAFSIAKSWHTVFIWLLSHTNHKLFYLLPEVIYDNESTKYCSRSLHWWNNLSKNHIKLQATAKKYRRNTFF